MPGFSYMSGSDRKRSLHVFDLSDRTRTSLLADNMTSFLKSSGRLCPDFEVEDEVGSE
jgi:hypothetical protein